MSVNSFISELMNTPKFVQNATTNETKIFFILSVFVFIPFAQNSGEAQTQLSLPNKTHIFSVTREIRDKLNKLNLMGTVSTWHS